MIENELDFKSIAEALQQENETLRLYILKLRYAKYSPLDVLSSGNVKKFLISNYVVIAAIGTLLFMALALTDTVKSMIKHK